MDRDERDVPGQGEVTRGEGCALLAESRPSGFLYVVEHPVVDGVGLKSVVAVEGQFGQDSDPFLFRRVWKQPFLIGRDPPVRSGTQATYASLAAKNATDLGEDSTNAG